MRLHLYIKTFLDNHRIMLAFSLVRPYFVSVKVTFSKIDVYNIIYTFITRGSNNVNVISCILESIINLSRNPF